jgi:two-component system chemotaxis response regulator CheB
MVEDGPITQWRCRVGHLFSPQALLEEHCEMLERTLWSTVVALEESIEITRDLLPALPDRAERLRAEEQIKLEWAGKIRELINRIC